MLHLWYTTYPSSRAQLAVIFVRGARDSFGVSLLPVTKDVIQNMDFRRIMVLGVIPARVSPQRITSALQLYEKQLEGLADLVSRTSGQIPQQEKILTGVARAIRAQCHPGGQQKGARESEVANGSC